MLLLQPDFLRVARQHDGMDRRFVRQVNKVCEKAAQLQLEGAAFHTYVTNALMGRFPQWDVLLIKERVRPVMLYNQYAGQVQVPFSVLLIQHILQHAGRSEIHITKPIFVVPTLLHTSFRCSSAM